MTQYMLRTLCVNDEVDSGVLAWIKEAGKEAAYCVIKHNADDDDKSPHWHAWFSSPKKLPALRMDFKKNNKGHVGNGSYSLKECKDTDAYLRYMCHADGEGSQVNVITFHGIMFNDEYFKEQNLAFYEQRRKFKEANSNKDLYDVVLKACKDRHMFTRSQIVHEYLRTLKELGKKTCNVYHARSACNMIYLTLCGQEAQNELADAILAQF